MTIERLLATNNIDVISRSAPAAHEAVFADIAALAIASADADRVLAATINTVKNDRRGCRVSLNEGVGNDAPGVQVVRRLERLGYFRNCRIDREGSAAHLGLSTRLSDEFRTRITDLDGGTRLELGAEKVVTSRAGVLGVDLEDVSRNVVVRFADGTVREIDVLAVVRGDLVAVECKLGRGFEGEGGRFADLSGRLGLAPERAILLATGLDEEAAADIAAFNPALSVSRGPDFASAIDRALAACRPDAILPTPRAPQPATPAPAEDRAGATANIVAAFERQIADLAEPLNINDIARLVHAELGGTKAPISRVAADLLRGGRCLGVDLQPVRRFAEPVAALATHTITQRVPVAVAPTVAPLVGVWAPETSTARSLLSRLLRR